MTVMSFIISILVLIAIFIGAACQLRRIFQVSKHGGCAACDYTCTSRRQPRRPLKHL